jgi:hypothetical protein
MWDSKETIEEMLRENPYLGSELSVVIIGFYADNALRIPMFFAPRKVKNPFLPR